MSSLRSVPAPVARDIAARRLATALEAVGRALVELLEAQPAPVPVPVQAAPAAEPDRLLRPKEAAALLGVGRTTFGKLKRQPGFPSERRVTGMPRWSREDLLIWMKRPT